MRIWWGAGRGSGWGVWRLIFIVCWMGAVCDVRGAVLPGDRGRGHVDVDMVVMDVWSFGGLLEEGELFYRVRGARLDLVGISFRDYVGGVGEWLDSGPDLVAGARSYWR